MKRNMLTGLGVLLLVFASCKEEKKEAKMLKQQEQTEVKTTNFTQWAETPPMGWNSWDCYGPTVTEKEVKANTDYMAENLKSFGWEYVVVDIRWFVENTKASGYNQTDPIYVMDEYGRYQPATNKFPSAKDGQGFKPLADYVHSKGLKFGIHIMRGIPVEAVNKKLLIKGTEGITADQIYSPEEQCKWLTDNYTVVADKPGAQEYYNSIMELYASWGVDFIKIDDLSAPIYHQGEIDLIRNAIDQTGREIVLSTSPGETPVDAAAHVDSHANMWRMVNDVWDEWWHMKHLIKTSEDWYPYIGDGTWPDCDMIPLGRISIRGERGEDRMTRLTKEEQYSLMSFFTIFKSPLFFGGDLPSNDEFTLSLLTNKDVLEMHEKATNVKQVFQTEDELAVTSKNPETGATYVALFNLGDKEVKTVSVTLEQLGLSEELKATNLWSGEAFEYSGKTVEASLKPHESILLKLQ
ncbi:Alpha galactosidase A [Pustulibacterium marinum]|uniref:Alpha-galactosidase n=1 Tax=Pustulibacterium marinum TaxID=1224947 RepID=A0A1I7I2J8_9FLAO|nr:glycoside hydrolase family 27 protein [Pustulibacterium marinum]SFU67158.1 Alpha galactosidase A [Pustulibacterium marinum]